MTHAPNTISIRGLLLYALLVLVPFSAGAQSGPPSLRIIVQLAVDTLPEARLSGPAARRFQRRRIAQRGLSLERRMRGSGARVLRRYASLPFVVLEVPHDQLVQLVAGGEVASIEGDRLFESTLAQSGEQIQATAVHSLGFDGSGWHVAVLDTGIETTHPALVGRADEEACFSALSDCPGGQSSAFGVGAAAPCGAGGCYHGTHVAGIALGDDPVFMGIAPGARLIAIQVFSEFAGSMCPGGGDCALAYTSDIISGLQHVYSLRDQYQIASVNLSVGGGSYSSQIACDVENGFMRSVIDDLRSAGIATVVASGNEGFVDALAAPGCISSAVSVGSVTKQSQISSFSNSADFLDLLAPGSHIVSSFPGQTFATLSGTSMATPHVAGAWALYRQRDTQASVDDVLSLLQAGGTPVFDTGNGLEHPLVQLGVDFVPEPGAAPLLLATLLSLGALRRRG